MNNTLAEGFILGKPRPKGSLKARAHRDGMGKQRITLHDDPASEAWKLTMIKWIQDHALMPGAETYPGPVAVEAVFYFARRESVNGGIIPTHDTPWPMSDDIGDVDKLQRNLGDALEQSGLIANDRNIVQWVGPRKEWVPRVPGLPLAEPGVWFQVTAL